MNEPELEDHHAHVAFAHDDPERMEELLKNVNFGPIKWCKRCSRKHRPRLGCGLVPTERIAKSGKIVTTMVQPDPEQNNE